MQTVGSFKAVNSFLRREKLSRSIRAMYPDRLPIIVETIDLTSLGPLLKQKFLAPSLCTAAKFMLEVRRQLQDQSQVQRALFLLVGEKRMLLQPSMLMSEAYTQYADPDGFLYIVATGENPFG